MTEEQQPPEEPQAPDAPEEGAPEEPVAPDEAGRSQPAEAGQDDQAPDAAPAAEPDQDQAAPAEPPPDAAQAQAATDEVVEATDEVVEATEEVAAKSQPEPETTPAEQAPRAKPEIPGADLEVDIVPEGIDPLAREAAEAALAAELEVEPEAEPAAEEPSEVSEPEPTARAVIDLAAGARYSATGKRKTAVARVILRPGKGEYRINGRGLDEHFPRPTLQRNIRQPLETVGYDSRMDVVAKLHGGGLSAQAGALRHGISRALIDADPNLRGELKRRGFLTRDPRVKERKKAGLKKARKRPQFSKR